MLHTAPPAQERTKTTLAFTQTSVHYLTMALSLLPQPTLYTATGGTIQIQLLHIAKEHVTLLIGEHLRNFLAASPCHEGQQ